MLAGVAGFCCHCFRIIVRNPCPGARVVEPRYACRRLPVTLESRIAKLLACQSPPIAVRLLPSLGCAARRLKESRIDVWNASIRTCKKWNSHQQLVGGNAADAERANAHIDIELRRGIIGGCE